MSKRLAYLPPLHSDEKEPVLFPISRRKKTARPLRPQLIFFRASLALAIVLALPGPLPAHHTSAITYVYQRVGEQAAGCYKIELAATPPRLALPNADRLSRSETHQKLDAFTHRFEIEVRRQIDLVPVHGPSVRLRFSGEGWGETFPLVPFTRKGTSAWGANVALGPRGAYGVTATIENIGPGGCDSPHTGRTLAVKFSYDYDYETNKQAMNALKDTLDKLGAMTLTLGLDGEFVPPRVEEGVNKQATKFKALVPWVVNLREGAAQPVYEDRAAKLLEAAEGIEAAAKKADWGALVHRLAEARAVCAACHEIFQEADSTGSNPKLPKSEK